MLFKRLLCTLLVVLLTMAAVSTIFVSAEETVLSVGKSYTVSFESNTENAYPKLTYQQESQLTDGEFASEASYSDDAFVHLYRGTYCSVTIDLESVCSVSSVIVSSLQQKSAGIYCPREVSVAVSEDGNSFGTVGTMEDPDSCIDRTAKVVQSKVVLDQAYKARYVRVTFNSDVFVYADEISIYGSADSSDALSAQADALTEDVGFSDGIDGIENICLMYTGGNYSVDTLLPIVAYLDTDKNVVDTMFDSILFLQSPSDSYNFTTQSGWEEYIASLFGNGLTNISALDKLIRQLKEKGLFAEDYTYPIFISVPYLQTGTDDFWGVMPINQENRVSILQKLIDLIVSTYESYDFQNLELKGFYWYEESVSYSNTNYEDDFIKSFNSYVHQLGYKSIWIPYYCAAGLQKAVELGFDSATLQSGYAFDHSQSETGDSKSGVVDDCAAVAAKYGLGMEFELDIYVSNFYQRFYKYLSTGYRSGCMNGHMMMMYQAVSNLYVCAYSSSASDERKVYDLLYAYIHDTFTSVAPVIPEGQIIIAKANSKVSGSIEVTDDDSSKNMLKVQNYVGPDAFSGVFEGDGFYLLNTKDSEQGVYTISLSVTDGYNTSDDVEVTVVIIDESAEQQTLKTAKEVAVYDNLSMEESIATIPAGTECSYLLVKDEIYYVSAVVGEETIAGVADGNQLGLISGDSSAVSLWIIVIVAAVALLAVIALVLILVKKKK